MPRVFASIIQAVCLAATLPLSAHGAVNAVPDVSTLLLRKTQAFSDAGQQGQGATTGAMLDDRVIFFNEGGDQATKSDLTASAPGPQAGVTTKMTVTDWRCEVHGDVAVTSFIDDQQQNFHGQPFHARYRSVETWQKEGSDWRMIGSATIALYDDPATVILTPDVLNQYVGVYEAGPGVRFIFTRNGQDLMASVSGGPPAVQKAEVKDVFFTPGRARATKVFARDVNGRVTGFVLRREGHDIHFRRI